MARDATSVDPAAAAAVFCSDLVKIFQTRDLEVFALQGLDLTVQPGEMVAIIGPSGAGKSTLLNILGALEPPTAGVARVAGRDLRAMTLRQRMEYRRQDVGFIWQSVSRNLLPYLTAAENVMMPMALDGSFAGDRARELLSLLGLDRRLEHRPAELSGGEQQRVAIAVGLANSPRLLLADEPTGSLDTDTAGQVIDALGGVRDALGVTVLIVTHDESIARSVDRYVAIRDGKTSDESVRVQAAEVSLSGDTHHHYALLDRAGRLQIPEAMRDTLGLERRVRIDEEGGRIIISPP